MVIRTDSYSFAVCGNISIEQPSLLNSLDQFGHPLPSELDRCAGVICIVFIYFIKCIFDISAVDQYSIEVHFTFQESYGNKNGQNITIMPHCAR